MNVLTMNIDELYRYLQTNHMQAQGIVDTIGDPLLVLDESLRVQNANRAFFETFNVDRYETIGQLYHELGSGQWNIPDLQRLLAEVIPKAAAVIDYEVEHDFPELGHRTMLVTARTLRQPGAASRYLLLSIVDATERFRADHAKNMMFAELRHRTKNLLSVAQAIARQTTTGARTAEEYRDDFLGRFEALVEGQELAFSAQEETHLVDVIKRIVGPFSADRSALRISGDPQVALAPQAVQALSMVFHELATNAAKYGALSHEAGRIEIEWHAEEAEEKLRLRWVERDGPEVEEPEKFGFGSQLIEYAATSSLGGEVEQSFAPDGLTVEIAFPYRSSVTAT